MDNGIKAWESEEDKQEHLTPVADARTEWTKPDSRNLWEVS